MEILAPAGNLEILKVAIQAGCDAVYISGKDFGARKFANNFTNEEMIEAITYAHLRNIKIYVTVNTIIYDEEWESLHEYLMFLSDIKVDALIVQDLGVLYYIRKNFPNLIVHASTQMNIHNVAGAKKLMELGVKRVVLARETPIDVVKDIINLGIEVEVFGHGALCYSQSGQCLMSYLIGGRSGNRGECAQPCRRTYNLYENGNVIGENISILSMKDLNTIDYVKKLRDLGVSSLKIEGRMKSPEYVSTVVNTYKSILNDLVVKDKIRKLQLAFNREFTKGFIFNAHNHDVTNINSVNHQGLKIGKVVEVTNKYIVLALDEEIFKGDAVRIKNADPKDNSETGFFINEFEKNNNDYIIKGKFRVKYGDIVYKVVDSNQTKYVDDLLNNEKYSINLSCTLIIKINQPLKMVISGNRTTITVLGDIVNELAEKPQSLNRIEEQVKKTDSKLIQFSDVSVEYDGVSFVPISAINKIRRDALASWTKEYLTNYKLESNDEFKLVNNINSYELIYSKFDFVVHTKEQYNWCIENGFTNVYPYYNHSYQRHMHNDYSKSNQIVHNLCDYKMNAILSPSCNIVNSKHLELLNYYNIKTAYLSNELSFDQIIDLSQVKTNYNIGVMIYGRPEMMVAKHCFINKVKNLKNINCKCCVFNNYEIEDLYGNKMKVYANCYKNSPELTIHHYKKINNFKYINDFIHYGIHKFLIILTDETIDELNKIKNRIRREGD